MQSENVASTRNIGKLYEKVQNHLNVCLKLSLINNKGFLELCYRNVRFGKQHGNFRKTGNIK